MRLAGKRLRLIAARPVIVSLSPGRGGLYIILRANPDMLLHFLSCSVATALKLLKACKNCKARLDMI